MGDCPKHEQHWLTIKSHRYQDFVAIRYRSVVQAIARQIATPKQRVANLGHKARKIVHWECAVRGLGIHDLNHY